MKALKGIGKFLLYVLVIVIFCVLLVIAGVWGYQKYKHHQISKELEQLPVDETQGYEITLHDHLDEKIGDNKMTVQEKLDAGLNPYKVDTSGNGISDYDAINKYHIDPTKFSTADDGISDYVKLEEGLDPTKKVDPDDIEEFKITDDDIGAELLTTNLNDKYYSNIEEYHEAGLDELYKPVRDPVRIKNYEGELTLTLPKNTGKEVKAYYFDIEKEDMVKIKKQKRTDNGILLTIDQDDPIYLIDSSVFDTIGEYYYFRLSLFQLSRAILGFDHQIFIFKRGIFTDKLFEEEEIEDIDYGIIQISRAEISKIYALALDGIYAALDIIFKPLDEADQNILTRALFDYGKIEGTPEYAQKYVMPWLYEDEEIETENDDSYKVVDSGFRLKHHSFPFGNLLTETGDGGVCAGFSRTTEFIFNDAGLEEAIHFKPEKWQSVVRNWLLDGELSALKYDISDQLEAYPFFDNGELFDYRFTDNHIKYLSEDTFVDADYTIKPSELSEPDKSLIELLETQWIYSNEQKHLNEPNDPFHVSVLNQVEEYLADGQILYASLGNSGGGHTVSVYKMEYDRYDPDLIRLYVYDPNLPYEKLKEFGKREVYMTVHKKERKLFSAVDKYEYFDFDYTPLEDQRASYSYSSDDGYTMMLYHNDEPLDSTE